MDKAKRVIFPRFIRLARKPEEAKPDAQLRSWLPSATLDALGVFSVFNDESSKISQDWVTQTAMPRLDTCNARVGFSMTSCELRVQLDRLAWTRGWGVEAHSWPAHGREPDNVFVALDRCSRPQPMGPPKQTRSAAALPVPPGSVQRRTYPRSIQ